LQAVSSPAALRRVRMSTPRISSADASGEGERGCSNVLVAIASTTTPLTMRLPAAHSTPTLLHGSVEHILCGGASPCDHLETGRVAHPARGALAITIVRPRGITGSSVALHICATVTGRSCIAIISASLASRSAGTRQTTSVRSPVAASSPVIETIRREWVMAVCTATPLVAAIAAADGLVSSTT
jgi:hypothetical protein